MDTPAWFSSLKWSIPVPLEEARVSRANIPASPGVYCFTNYPGALMKNTGVLYVGKAGKSVQSRVQTYLVDPNTKTILGKSGNVSSSLKHAGKAQLLVKIQQRSRSAPPGSNAPSGIWVRWLVCSGPEVLEGMLITYLRPAYNTSGKPLEE